PRASFRSHELPASSRLLQIRNLVLIKSQRVCTLRLSGAVARTPSGNRTHALCLEGSQATTTSWVLESFPGLSKNRPRSPRGRSLLARLARVALGQLEMGVPRDERQDRLRGRVALVGHPEHDAAVVAVLDVEHLGLALARAQGLAELLGHLVEALDVFLGHQ